MIFTNPQYLTWKAHIVGYSISIGLKINHYIRYLAIINVHLKDFQPRQRWRIYLKGMLSNIKKNEKM